MEGWKVVKADSLLCTSPVAGFVLKVVELVSCLTILELRPSSLVVTCCSVLIVVLVRPSSKDSWDDVVTVLDGGAEDGRTSISAAWTGKETSGSGWAIGWGEGVLYT